MSDMQKPIGLYEVQDILRTTVPSDVSEDVEDAMSDVAWELWSQALYNYPDSIVPRSVLATYVEELEMGEDGYY